MEILQTCFASFDAKLLFQHVEYSTELGGNCMVPGSDGGCGRRMCAHSISGSREDVEHRNI